MLGNAMAERHARSPARAQEGPLAELSDREIGRLWVGGDARVIGEVDRRYRRRLEAVALRIVGSQADAEDVVQRVFLALPSAAYSGAASLWTYLYRAATNTAINLLRARRRRAGLEEALAPVLAAQVQPDAGPESTVLEGEILAGVARALLHVKPQHRRALVLRILWGLTNTEIAEQEGVPLATVSTWLRRGREELRRALGPMARDLAGEDPR
jgi:RNA polymerase sigma-70 factor (ECF subfamily)